MRVIVAACSNSKMRGQRAVTVNVQGYTIPLASIQRHLLFLLPGVLDTDTSDLNDASIRP